MRLTPQWLQRDTSKYFGNVDRREGQLVPSLPREVKGSLVRQLALDCGYGLFKEVYTMYENTRKCGELEIYFPHPPEVQH